MLHAHTYVRMPTVGQGNMINYIFLLLGIIIFLCFVWQHKIFQWEVWHFARLVPSVFTSLIKTMFSLWWCALGYVLIFSTAENVQLCYTNCDVICVVVVVVLVVSIVVNNWKIKWREELQVWPTFLQERVLPFVANLVHRVLSPTFNHLHKDKRQLWIFLIIWLSLK